MILCVADGGDVVEAEDGGDGDEEPSQIWLRPRTTDYVYERWMI